MSFHQISWVVLRFQWQKFAQNKKAKAPQPADSYCTRSPLGRSGSALTYSFLSKKLSCRGLRDLPKRPGLEPDGRRCTWAGGAPRLHPSRATRAGATFLHTKLLAIYATMIFPINKPNP